MDFLKSFNITYNGKWESKNKIQEFKDTKGEMKYNHILLNGNQDVKDSLFIASFFFKDEKYIENSYLIKIDGFLFQNEFIKVDVKNKQINSTKTANIYYKKLLDIKKYYSKINLIYFILVFFIISFIIFF
jgi:hypothetical protein